ncbi:MAG: hypothetical protein M1830_009951, partial [Pleopsidium flavum]
MEISNKMQLGVSEASVHFPGAVNSKFTTNLSFERPSTHPAIPTYRVMDSDGAIVDETRAPEDVSDHEVLKWYKNMLTGILDMTQIRQWVGLTDMDRKGFSEYHGLDHVRCTETGATELLYGANGSYLPNEAVSAGEEGIAVGSASALTPEDVIFAQYRETGVFQQRGFTLENFMS